MSTVRENAEHALKLHKTRRAGDLTVRSQALQELQEALDLPVALLRIECFDISHVQGTNVVASMVVVEDGLPKKSDYRKFSVTGAAAADDTAAMHDVLTRRFRHYLQDKTAQVGGRPPDCPAHQAAPRTPPPPPRSPDTTTPAPRAKFAYPPNLVVVDGGKPQVNAAARALAELGIEDVYVVGLAKRLEEVWLPDSDFPVILPRTSAGALPAAADPRRGPPLRHHLPPAKARQGHDGLGPGRRAGLGEAKRKALLAHFGSVKGIRAATRGRTDRGQGHRAVPGRRHRQPLQRRTAQAAARTVPAINMTTGEI